MTSKTKYILLGVTGLGVVGGAFVLFVAVIVGIGLMAAQAEEPASEKDLPVAAKNRLYKQSDVDALIAFHEWATETRFSAVQRKKFEAFLAKDFERDAAKARKDTDGLIEAHAQIKKAEKDVQAMTRQLLVPATIEDFRKKSDDFSRFMLAIYEKTGEDENISAGNQNETKPETKTDKKAALKTESEFAPDLIGKWTRTEGSGYVDPTGKTKYRSGAEFTFRFAADGTMEYSFDKKVLTVMQCNIAETKTAGGYASVSGDTLTINFGEMNHTSENSCNDAETFEKTLPAETVQFRWRLKTEYETTRLCIVEKDGEMCYDRKV